MSDSRSRTADVGLALFFTANTGLRHWKEAGILNRETAVYRHLARHLRALAFVTHGDARDLGLARGVGAGISLTCNRFGLPGRLYRGYLERLAPLGWTRPWVVKSNQVQGSDIALRAARHFHLPFIARCGYLFSDFMEREHGEDSDKARLARKLEADVFPHADRIVVTTSAMRTVIRDRYAVDPRRIDVIPNYVDTRLFAPMAEPRPRREAGARVGFVGRFAPQKNLPCLVEALRGVDATLVLIGDGPQGEALRRQARESGVRVEVTGRVPHDALPALLGSLDVFVLPSLYEGHPKSLIEAMACGLPVVGTDVPGIREEIRNGETGIVCPPDAPALGEAIGRLIADRGLAGALGAAARDAIVATYSLERTVEAERAVLEKVLRRP